VLVNLGANHGEALDKWVYPERHPENIVSATLVNEGLWERFERAEQKVHLIAVESNEDNWESLREKKRILEDEGRAEVTIVEGAGWIKNGTMKMIEGDYFMRVNGKEGKEVKTFDVGEILKRNCKEEDVCVCGMDIEGAEFEILRDLFIKKKVGCLCDVLIVEWHEMTNQDDSYLLVNDFGNDRFTLKHVPAEFLPAAVMDGALRYMLDARDDECPTVYIGFRYDQAVFDI
jgi:FkbM family methyltransferase